VDLLHSSTGQLLNAEFLHQLQKTCCQALHAVQSSSAAGLVVGVKQGGASSFMVQLAMVWMVAASCECMALEMHVLCALWLLFQSCACMAWFVGAAIIVSCGCTHLQMRVTCIASHTFACPDCSLEKSWDGSHDQQAQVLHCS
jgi:hypothetical protein